MLSVISTVGITDSNAIFGYFSKEKSNDKNSDNKSSKVQSTVKGDSPISIPKEINDTLKNRIKMSKNLFSEKQKLAIKEKKLSDIESEQANNERLINEEINKKGFNKDTVNNFSKKNFFSQLKKKEAEINAALSAFVYHESKEKKGKIVPSEKSIKSNGKIKEKTELLNALKKSKEKIDKSFSGNAGKFNKSFDDYKTMIGKTFGIYSTDGSYQNINKAVNDKITEIEVEINELSKQALLEQNKEIISWQGLVNNHSKFKDLEVKAVMHRNNGEFSGLILYDKNTHTVRLAFAGSKSKMDWVNNFFAWNAKSSSKRGYFSGMNFHSGILSHFDSIDDSSFAIAKDVMRVIAESKKEETLNIVGTGHSLGGALASLFTASTKEIASSLGINVNLRAMTFGAPSILHGNSVDRFNEYFGGAGNLIHVRNSKDPVPKAVFWKDGGGVSLQFQGALFRDSTNAFQIFGRNPHSSDGYANDIGNAISKWQNNVSYIRKLSILYSNRNNKIQKIKKDLINSQNKMSKNVLDIVKFDEKNAEFIKSQKKEYLSAIDLMKNKEISRYKKALDEAKRNTDKSQKTEDLMEAEVNLKIMKGIYSEAKNNKIFSKYSEENKRNNESKIEKLEKNLSESTMDFLNTETDIVN